MKRIFALLLSLAVLFSCLAVTAGAMFDPSTVYDVKAQSAYIVNTDTNIIVYEKDSEKQVSAGGLTKYMTIALVLTNYADRLDNTFTMPLPSRTMSTTPTTPTCARARPSPTGRPFMPW